MASTDQNQQLQPEGVDGATIKLGEINALIAPLSVNGDGLAMLGFRHVRNDRNAKLYAADDFPRICDALVELIQKAHMQHNGSEVS